MATVYLADDLRHGRKVAVKVVHPELAAVLGAERFLTEIHTTAGLQHPHILPLFDSGSADGQLYYVMPYVEGESLRSRMTRERQLPISDAVQLAREIASALDYAHRQGVVHRDIKPENVLLHDGQAVVADFGIALAVTNAGGGRLTQTGLSLGTPQYMSPEQATGERDIDGRSDVYSLGAVTYEMLTGEPPFSGPSAQAIIAKVITTDPGSLVARRRSIPPHVEDAVLTALEKVPADRFGSAADFAEALQDPAASRQRRASTSATRAAAPRRTKWLVVAPVLGALALGAVAGWLAKAGRSSDTSAAQFSFTVPVDQRISDFADPAAALSADGSMLVYSGVAAGGINRLYVRTLDNLLPRPLSGTDNGCCATFSTDGKSLAFVSEGVWKRISADGGAATVIPVAAAKAEVTALRWTADDDFIVSTADGALGHLRSDGTVKQIARPDTSKREGYLALQAVLPDRSILAIGVVSLPAGHILMFDADGKNRTVIDVPDATWAGYSDGHLVWTQAGAIYAAPFNLKSRKITGAIQSLGLTAQGIRGAAPKMAAGRTSLAFVPAQPLTLVRVNRNGIVTTMIEQPRSYHSPRVSPDGRRIALDFSETTRDVWLLDLGDNALSRLTFENSGHDPTWLPNGKELLFAAEVKGQIGIFKTGIDGSGGAQPVLFEGPQITAHAVTPDGKTAIAVRAATGTFRRTRDLVGVPLDGSKRSFPILTSLYDEQFPGVSRDGKWLAYVTNEANREEVFVRPMSGQGAKVLVSQNGGTEPVWSRDGHELFYRSLGPGDPQLIAAAISASPEFHVVSRTPLFSVDDYEGAEPHANYDVMPDGKSFVMVRQGRLSEFAYLQNWTATLKQKGAAAKQ